MAKINSLVTQAEVVWHEVRPSRGWLVRSILLRNRLVVQRRMVSSGHLFHRAGTQVVHGRYGDCGAVALLAGPTRAVAIMAMVPQELE